MTPAMLYGLETLPVSEKHQHRLQVCENNWVRQIAGEKRMDRRRMDELRGGWHTEVIDGKIGEESDEVGRTRRTNERGSTTKDGICSPGEGKERKTTYEMARLHRERHEKGGVAGRGLEDGGPG